MAIGNYWQTWATCDHEGCKEKCEGFPGDCMGGGPFNSELPYGWTHAWYRLPRFVQNARGLAKAGRPATFCPIHSHMYSQYKGRDLTKPRPKAEGYLSLV